MRWNRSLNSHRGQSLSRGVDTKNRETFCGDDDCLRDRIRVDERDSAIVAALCDQMGEISRSRLLG